MARKNGLLYRFIRGLLVLALVFSVASLAYIWNIGAWHFLFPSTQHDTVAPALPAGLSSPAVLVFSKTNGYRHRDGIAGGAQALSEIANARDWSYFHTENGAVFNARDLARFDAVVFLNVTGDILDTQQEDAFQQWLAGGGGWLGIHSAGDTQQVDWRWYMDELIGPRFTAHIMSPQFQRATVVLENQRHPALRGIPDIWTHVEEWYSWDGSPRELGFTILATLDEDSYTPVQKVPWSGTQRDLRMGDHPVVWSRCIDSGRSLYTAMGHKAEAFEQPQFRLLLENSLSWLMGGDTDSDQGC